MIRFTCPTCQKILKAPPDWAGRKTKCTQCEQRMVIPTPPQATNQTVLGQLAPSTMNAAASLSPTASLTVNCPGCGRVIVLDPNELHLTIQCVQCQTCFNVSRPAPPSPNFQQPPTESAFTLGGSANATPEYNVASGGRCCPFCAEPINPDAMKCKHCGELLDRDMRAAKAELEGQADSVGIIAIVLAALALIGTIGGMFCMGYGALVGVPIALAGLIVAIFAGKKKKAALILNSAALVPPIVLGAIAVAITLIWGASFTMCCCGLGASGSPSPSPHPAPQQSASPKKPAPELDVIFQYSPGKVVGKKVRADSPIPPGWVGGAHEVSAENLGRENRIRAMLADSKEGDTAQLLLTK
jgi:predicted nucleic acid-binding Zn ribbon protein